MDPRVVCDLKCTISDSKTQHFSDLDQKKLVSVCYALDPRFKSLKFLPSTKKKDLFTLLQSMAQEQQCLEITREETPHGSPSKRPKKAIVICLTL